MTDVSDEGCANCAHSFNPHVLVALGTDLLAGIEVPVGGVLLCPDCDCASTWSVTGYPEQEMPPAAVLQSLRGQVARER